MFDRKILKSRAKFVLSRTLFASIIACVLVKVIANGGFALALSGLQNISFIKLTEPEFAEFCKLAGIIGIAALVFFIFLIEPLNVGLKHFMLRGADLEANTENLKYPFIRNYKNILWVTFVKNLYIGLWALLGLVPVVILLWKLNVKETVLVLLTSMLEKKSILATIGLTTVISGILLLTISFLMPAIIKGLQYSMVGYILAENPNTKRAEAIGRSKEMMVGYKWEYVKLVVSFLGWFVAANAFCCGIGLFILIPYIEATYAQMYLEISGQGKDYSTFDFRNMFGRFGNM